MEILSEMQQSRTQAENQSPDIVQLHHKNDVLLWKENAVTMDLCGVILIDSFFYFNKSPRTLHLFVPQNEIIYAQIAADDEGVER